MDVALGSMGKTFNEAVRKQFAARIAMVAPQFRPSKAPTAYAWPGERAYVWNARPGVKCWISLVTSPKGYNEFFLEVGWSTLGRYPELAFRPTLAGMEDALSYPEFMCRLSSLGDTPGAWKYEPPGFEQASEAERFMVEVQAALATMTPSEADEAARPLVEDATNALVHIGIPFLERSAISLSGGSLAGDAGDTA